MIKLTNKLYPYQNPSADVFTVGLMTVITGGELLTDRAALRYQAFSRTSDAKAKFERIPSLIPIWFRGLDAIASVFSIDVDQTELIFHLTITLPTGEEVVLSSST
jgi:hypothetical protein